MAAKPVVELTPQQFFTLPSRAFIKKYEKHFPDREDETAKKIELQSVNELDLLKFAGDPAVRE